MKRTCKKLVSALLALLMLTSLFSIPASAVAYTDIPTVYLHGYGSPLYDSTTSADHAIYPISMPKDFASRVLDIVKKPIAKGMFLGQWDDFHKLVIDEVTAIYGTIALDHNGEVNNGTGTPFVYQDGPVPNNARSDGSCNIRGYWFQFDWRLDPFVLAEQLDRYIDAVLAATNAGKVNLVGRCYGGNIVLAYLDTFGSEKIQSICFYASGFSGFEEIGAMFSGELNVDPDILTVYLETADTSELGIDKEDPTYDLLISLIRFLNAAKTLKVGEAVLKSYLIPEFKKYILPEVLRNTYGTLPCFWSFVGDEYYDEAKRVVFGGQEEEWAGLIEKADHYHYQIMNRADEIVAEAVSDGVRVYNFVKYGYVILPIIADGDRMGDGTVSTANSSLGATTASVFSTLSSDDIAKTKAENGGKYLSPDLQIDASTCLLPDHTWFIKHLYHSTNPESLEVIMADIFNYDGYATVFDFEQYPQYMDYDAATDTYSPLQADENNSPAKPQYRFFRTWIDLMRQLFRFLKAQLSK